MQGIDIVCHLAALIAIQFSYHSPDSYVDTNIKCTLNELQAALMAQMAEAFGVPKERIRIEAKSENTYENAVKFNKMFVDKNIKIGLVTSAYHMKRSATEFRKFFSNVIPLPSNYLYASPVGIPAVRYIPQSQWLYNNQLVFREYVGQLWYSIKDI